MDEPNLSLRPMPTPVFRFTYGSGRGWEFTILTLTPTRLVAKQAIPTEEAKLLPDVSRLDTLEQRLVRLLDRRYPIDERPSWQKPRMRRYLDSMGQRYPQRSDRLRLLASPAGMSLYSQTITHVFLIALVESIIQNNNNNNGKIAFLFLFNSCWVYQ